MSDTNNWINAVIGAVITVALSFTGFSPLLGGGVAAYLQGESPSRGAKIGAISGIIAMIPVLLFAIVGVTLFAMASPMRFSPPGGVESLIIFAIMVPIMAMWIVGLSTAGGYLGAYIHENA